MLEKKPRTSEPRNLDPEPIALALALLSAVVGSAGLIINMKRNAREIAQGRANVRASMFQVDLAISRLITSYQDLVEIYYGYPVLEGVFALGKNPMFVTDEVANQLFGIYRNINESSIELQQALIEMSKFGGYVDDRVTLNLARRLQASFERAKKAKTLIEFMILVGRMLKDVIHFTERMAQAYQYNLEALSGTNIDLSLSRLEARYRGNEGNVMATGGFGV